MLLPLPLDVIQTAVRAVTPGNGEVSLTGRERGLG